MPSPVEEIYPFGLLVKSWATGLDYFSKSFAPNAAPAKAPTTAIAQGATWALPPMNSVYVPVTGSTTPAAISAVAMSWDTFASILHNANNITPLGAITNPTNASNVVIVQGDSDTLLLRLPPRLRLQQAEAALMGGQVYGIPAFYNDLYNSPGGAPPAAPVIPLLGGPGGPAAVLQLHANRIGDYTMSSCN